ncbi:MAG TPA: hypothetical protein VL362_00165 [Patescibacteria group bacterium]|nr:hypothetical protein [Patescibacteria group bacterium]
MYPDNNPQPQQVPPQQQFPQPVQPQPEYSVEYLNQLAGETASKPGGPSKIVMLIAGVVGLLALVLFAFMVFAGGPSAADKASSIYVRLQTLQSLANDNQKQLRNNDLRAINSGLSLQLTNAATALEEPLANIGVNTKKLPKSLQTKEATYKSNVQSQFDDAKLNVRLDSTYTREMTYQLESLHAMLQSAYKATSSKSLKDYLKTTDAQLAPFIDKLSSFKS